MGQIANEDRRVETLRMYNILDTAAEKSFDDFTRLAAAICEAPISLVSFVDGTRQWFKSRHGLKPSETPRDQAFCDHAIRQSEVMVVEDATLDPRFSENPLVVGEPNIRFYAGAPLTVSENCHLGTLCVIDRKPRKLSDSQLDSLAILRDAVVAQLELRRAVEDMRTLARLMPMCAWCRSVRLDDHGTWQPLHEYVADNANVTHSICPSCQESLHEEVVASVRSSG